MLTAIIVAGGSSRRMGFDKTFALLGDKPVIAHSAAAFQSAENVADIIVVGRQDCLEQLRETLTPAAFGKLRAFVAGGAQRQDSVAAGLKQLSPAAEFIAVHDAARPLVTPSAIERVYAAAREHGAASLAAPVVDTLKRADETRLVTGSVDREGVYAMQTPQIFSRELLMNAYGRVAASNGAITDEVSAVEALGHKVVLVPNDDFNFKITFAGDLELARLVLAQRQQSATH
ncbi:MAG: 2-C-methyl-D-erythritol 4-phosphate cytidylyltransferase [uncultured Chthoniobacterales bacterium]|uniref:2-C-methyl-D-erythritol 4-phosphate cytidylyltransferase n=1 Tax=uncultured Chthoniobacterales bacterium TaxID=1836801 RepID=A0A6J4J0U7_9BACT|nr:MAG: 2-C-methyl-D-erythritol 4-phosphate cytidylyltransferase [uncultured Chthoniobacterales bacterium]